MKAKHNFKEKHKSNANQVVRLEGKNEPEDNKEENIEINMILLKIV